MTDIPEQLRRCIHLAECARPSKSGEFETRLFSEMALAGYELPENLLLSFDYLDVTSPMLNGGLEYDPVTRELETVRLYIVNMVHVDERKKI